MDQILSCRTVDQCPASRARTAGTHLLSMKRHAFYVCHTISPFRGLAGVAHRTVSTDALDCTHPGRRKQRQLARLTSWHCAGLTDKEGGKLPIVFDVDDKLLKREKRSISRADVATVCVQSLGIAEARNRSIDCINDSDAAEGAAVPSTTDDFTALFKGLAGNADYSLNVPA